MAIRRPPTVFSESISSADLATGAALDNLAADSITIAKMGTMMSVGETAPTGPFIGQQWFRLSTGVTYQFTNDGTSSFWLDVSSGGIGTSASKSVDFVGDVDPHKATNGSGLAVGNVYYNKTKNKHFICNDATNNANVWVGKYDAWGGTLTEYSSGGTNYRVHTFLTGGTFISDVALTADILIVGAGGGGGYDNGGDGAGGGGGGGMVYGAAKVMEPGDYSITVTDGGVGGTSSAAGTNGGNTTIAGRWNGAHGTTTTATATGGGFGGNVNIVGGNGGNGGGGGGSGTSRGGGSGTQTNQLTGTSALTRPNDANYDGGANHTTSFQGGGGGGAGGTGTAGANADPGSVVGGIPYGNVYRLGTNTNYAEGGEGVRGVVGAVGASNTGDGGGGSTTAGKAGGSGIVIIRYAIS